MSECSVDLRVGDCLEVLRQMPSESVHCCVTSPPYWGLRDYGHEGQIGLEPTPEEYVAKILEVFREVRRVLRDDGTCWLNLGDSYASSGVSGKQDGVNEYARRERGQQNNGPKQQERVYGRAPTAPGLKPKDLIGIPWRVAFALQQPYYTGVVADERDRVWLAAMLDAEGSICASEYATGDRLKSNIYIGITNASVPIIEKCGRLFPQAKENVYQKGGVVNRTVFRWDVERMDQKSLFIREVYPYLVAKRKQAILGYTFIEMQRGLPSKKKGYLPDQQDKRSWLVQAISALNKGGDVDLPDWAVEPPSLFEPGYYLRQDIVWAKPSPMPESVRDRCTKAHEYLFLLTKSPRYYFDAVAIKEPAATAGKPMKTADGWDTAKGSHGSFHRNGRENGKIHGQVQATTRNRRSVWTIASQPFKGAHFATFPPKLVEPCIIAGTSEMGCCPHCGTPWERFAETKKLKRERPNDTTKRSGERGTGNHCPNTVAGVEVTTITWVPQCKCSHDEPVPCTVLDPFAGSGTTLAVALKHRRRAIGIELNEQYAELARERVAETQAELEWEAKNITPSLFEAIA